MNLWISTLNAGCRLNFLKFPFEWEMQEILNESLWIDWKFEYFHGMSLIDFIQNQILNFCAFFHQRHSFKCSPKNTFNSCQVFDCVKYSTKFMYTQRLENQSTNTSLAWRLFFFHFFQFDSIWTLMTFVHYFSSRTSSSYDLDYFLFRSFVIFALTFTLT